MRKITVLVMVFAMVAMAFPAQLPAVKGAAMTEDTNVDFSGGTLMNLSVQGTGSAGRLQMNRSLMWRAANTAIEPGIASSSGMAGAYIPDLSSTLLYYMNQTWLYNVSNNTWTQLFPGNSPPKLYYPSLAYDAYAKKVVLFGGRDMSNNYRDDTWTFSVSTMNWANPVPATRPQTRNAAVMAYDPQDAINGRIVLFGGYRGASPWVLQDTWLYNATTNVWTQVWPGTPPTGRELSEMTFDQTANRIILFGGYDSTWTTMADTWSYNIVTNTWTNLNPPSPPLGMYGGGLVYSPALGRDILVGGYTYTGFVYVTDTWLYDSASNRWSKLTVNGSYAGQTYGILTYDTSTNITLLVRGSTPAPFTCLLGNLTVENAVYTSNIKDSGSSTDPVHWDTVTWSGDLSNVSVSVQLASNNDGSSWVFKGPDGTSATYYTCSTGQEIPKQFDGDRYLRYRVYMNSTIPIGAASLDKVEVTYNHKPDGPRLVYPEHGSYVNTTTPTFQMSATDFNGDVLKLDLELTLNNFNDVTAYDQTISSAGFSAASYPSGAPANFTMPGGVLLNGKTYQWRARAFDGWVWGPYSNAMSFTVDATAPVGPDAVNDGVGADIDFTANNAAASASWTEARDFESGVARYWACLGTSAGTADVVALTDAGKYPNITFTVALQQGTKYFVNVQAENGAGIVSAPVSSDGFVLDTTPPTTPVVDDKTNITNDPTTLTASWTCSEDVSPIVEYMYAIGNSTGAENEWPWTFVGQDTQVRNSNLMLKNGRTYYLSVKARNAAGLWSDVGSSDGISVDTSLPANAVTVSIRINGDATYTTSRNVNLSVTPTDQSSKIAQVQFSNDGVVWSNWSSPAVSYDWRMSELDGIKSVYARVTDPLGRIGPAAGDTIMLDSTPPVLERFEAAPEFSANRSFAFTLGASDVTSGVKDMRIDAGSGGQWTTFSATATVSVSEGDGAKVILAYVKDAAGNVGPARELRVYLDTTPPQDVTIVLNNGAPVTSSRAVNVRLAAIDAVSGVDSYALRSNGTDWSAWIPFAASGNFTLSEGDGLKVVFLKVRDRVGNEAQAQASVILQTSQPTITVTSPSEGKTIGGKVSVKGTVQSSLTVDRIEVSIDGGGWQAASGTGPWSFTLDSSQYANGPHTLKVRAVTAAGPSTPSETTLKFKNGPAAVTVDTLSGLTIGLIFAILLAVVGVALWAREVSRRGRGGPGHVPPETESGGETVSEPPEYQPPAKRENPRPNVERAHSAAPPPVRQTSRPEQPPQMPAAEKAEVPQAPETSFVAAPASEAPQAPPEPASPPPQPEPAPVSPPEPTPTAASEARRTDLDADLDAILKKLRP